MWFVEAEDLEQAERRFGMDWNANKFRKLTGKIRKNKCGSCLPAKMRHHLTYRHACISQCIACNSSPSCGGAKIFSVWCVSLACFERRSHGRQQELERKYVVQDHWPLSWQNIWPLRADINSDQTSEVVNSVVQVSCQVWLARFGGRAAPSSRPWETPENGTCQTDRCKLC